MRNPTSSLPALPYPHTPMLPGALHYPRSSSGVAVSSDLLHPEVQDALKEGWATFDLMDTGGEVR